MILNPINPSVSFNLLVVNNNNNITFQHNIKEDLSSFVFAFKCPPEFI